ncbi:MAG TPA: hypothetical protein VJQ84_03110 [Solirubrobacterales bacterium]|nr:hypothetical protein [Solirubrobacterales bacterium]
MAALAQTAGAVTSEWNIEGKSMTGLGQSEEEISPSGGPLSISVPSLGGLSIKCEKVGGSGKIFKKGTDELSLSLTACSAAKTCKVKEPLKITGKTELILSGTTYYDKLVPLKEGESLATIGLSGELCAFPESTVLKGTVAGESTMIPDAKEPIVFSEAITKTANEKLGKPLELLFGKNLAYLSGEVGRALNGKGNAGKIWYEETGTWLCKIQTRSCQGEDIWPFETNVKFENTDSMRFTFSKISMVCTYSALTGFSEELANVPLPILGVAMESITFVGCSAFADPECSASVEEQPYLAFFTSTNRDDIGAIRTDRHLLLKFECEGLTCIYKAFSLLTVHNGAVATATREPVIMDRVAMGSDIGCSETSLWDGTGAGNKISYEIVEPTPLWVTS